MSLLQRLQEVMSDDREIESVLRLVAGGPQALIPEGLEFYTNANPPERFARLKFKGNTIRSLEPGPALRTEDAQAALVELARHETAHTHGSFVASRVAFSTLPLVGSFSWSDTLRIRPCPETTAIGTGLDWDGYDPPTRFHPRHVGPPFPFLIEVRVPRSPSGLLDGQRTLRALDRYQSLLGLLLARDVGPAHWPSDRVWAPLRVEGRLENHLVSPGFALPEDGRQDDFPELDCGPAKFHEGEDYYERLGLEDQELLIPHTLSDDLAVAHSLGRDAGAAFDRACYWFALGMQFRSVPAVAFVAFATAIECLLPRPKGPLCLACGKPTGPGPTKLFNEHIKQYGTVIPELHKRRSRLYDARSDLVHGNRVAHVDHDFFSAQRHTQEDMLLAQIVGKRSLINWLRDPERSV